MQAQLAGAFSQPGSLVCLSEMSDRNRTCQPGRVTPHTDVQPGLTTSENALFRAGQCAPVRAHRQQVPKASSLEAKHRRPRCKQDECTSSSPPAVSGTRHSTSEVPLHLCR